MIRFATIGNNIIVEKFLSYTKNIIELEYVSTYSRKKETAEKFAKKHNAKR